MKSLVGYVQTLRYPGRFIVLGMSQDTVFAIYGATGRSAASRARKYVMDEHNDVWAERTDEVVVKEGNLELLEYRALKWFENGFAIANGRQIELVRNPGFEQVELMDVEPEPDKYLTPRITGVISHEGATLYMVRSIDDAVERRRWQLILKNGVGYFISTYTGEDVRPTPTFSGDPVELEVQFGSVNDVARALFEAQKPKAGQEDYRVGVVGATLSKEMAIYNKM